MTPLEDIHQQVKDCLRVKVQVVPPQPLKVNDTFSVTVDTSNKFVKTEAIALVFTDIKVTVSETEFAKLQLTQRPRSPVFWPIGENLRWDVGREIFDLKAVGATCPNDVIATVYISANFNFLHNQWVHPHVVNVECKVDPG